MIKWTQKGKPLAQNNMASNKSSQMWNQIIKASKLVVFSSYKGCYLTKVRFVLTMIFTFVTWLCSFSFVNSVEWPKKVIFRQRACESASNIHPARPH
jgi:hypothetical protein